METVQSVFLITFGFLTFLFLPYILFLCTLSAFAVYIFKYLSKSFTNIYPKNTNSLVTKGAIQIMFSIFVDGLLVIGTGFVTFLTASKSIRLAAITVYLTLGASAVMYKWLLSSGDKSYVKIFSKVTGTSVLFAISKIFVLKYEGCHPVILEPFYCKSFFCKESSMLDKNLKAQDYRGCGCKVSSQDIVFECSYNPLIKPFVNKTYILNFKNDDGSWYLKKQGVLEVFGISLLQYGLEEENYYLGENEEAVSKIYCFFNSLSKKELGQSCYPIIEKYERNSEILHSPGMLETIRIFTSGEINDYKFYSLDHPSWVGEEKELKSIECNFIKSLFTDPINVSYHNIKFFGTMRLDMMSLHLSRIKNYDFLKGTKSKLYRSDLCEILKDTQEKISLCPYKKRRSSVFKTLDSVSQEEKFSFLLSKGYDFSPSKENKEMKTKKKKKNWDSFKNNLRLERIESLKEFEKGVVKIISSNNDKTIKTEENEFYISKQLLETSFNPISYEFSEMEFLNKIEKSYLENQDNLSGESLNNKACKWVEKELIKTDLKVGKKSKSFLENREIRKKKMKEKFLEENKNWAFKQNCIPSLFLEKINKLNEAVRKTEENVEKMIVKKMEFNKIRKLKVNKYKITLDDYNYQIKHKKRDQKPGVSKRFKRWQLKLMLFVYLIHFNKNLNKKNDTGFFSPINLKASRSDLNKYRNRKGKGEGEFSEWMMSKMDLAKKKFESCVAAKTLLFERIKEKSIEMDCSKEIEESFINMEQKTKKVIEKIEEMFIIYGN